MFQIWPKSARRSSLVTRCELIELPGSRWDRPLERRQELPGVGFERFWSELGTPSREERKVVDPLNDWQVGTPQRESAARQALGWALCICLEGDTLRQRT